MGQLRTQHKAIAADKHELELQLANTKAQLAAAQEKVRGQAIPCVGAPLCALFLKRQDSRHHFMLNVSSICSQQHMLRLPGLLVLSQRIDDTAFCHACTASATHMPALSVVLHVCRVRLSRSCWRSSRRGWLTLRVLCGSGRSAAVTCVTWWLGTRAAARRLQLRS